jgi:hypothetical protein
MDRPPLPPAVAREVEAQLLHEGDPALVDLVVAVGHRAGDTHSGGVAAILEGDRAALAEVEQPRGVVGLRLALEDVLDLLVEPVVVPPEPAADLARLAQRAPKQRRPARRWQPRR